MNSLVEVKRLVESGYELQTLYNLMSDEDFSMSDISKLEDVINRLEIHENEIRMLRQSLSLRFRQHVFESYMEGLKKRSEHT